MFTVNLTSQPSSVAFHPKVNGLLAIGKMDGTLTLLDLQESPSKPRIVWEYKKAKHPTRSILFVPCKRTELAEWEIWCSTSDGLLRIFSVTSGALKSKYKNMHKSPINCMLLLEEEDGIVATGSDDGEIKIWKDLECIQEYNYNEDFISGMRYQQNKKLLFVTSGEGSLFVYQVKKDTIYAQSEVQDDEYGCLEFACDNEWLYAFSISNTIDAYKWDYWGISSCKIPDLEFSVDSVCKINEGLLLLGCSDGYLRLLEVPENLFVSSLKVGEFPIETICKSKEIVVCSSHEDCIFVIPLVKIMNQKKVLPKQKSTQPQSDFYSELM